jgi:hypothetical protein
MDRELTPEESARLAELRTALQSEWEVNEAERKSNTAIQDITELKADALATLKHIVKHSDNEGMRAKVAMWAYERILESEDRNGDPLNELLKGMPATTPTDTTPAVPTDKPRLLPPKQS